MGVQQDAVPSSSEPLWTEGGQLAWKLVRRYHEGQTITFVEYQVPSCSGLNSARPKFLSTGSCEWDFNRVVADVLRLG